VVPKFGKPVAAGAAFGAVFRPPVLAGPQGFGIAAFVGLVSTAMTFYKTNH
jgi:hypothetical protein